MSVSDTTDVARTAATERILRAITEGLTQAVPGPQPRDAGPGRTPPPAVPEPTGDAGAEELLGPVLAQMLQVVVSAAPGILHGLLEQNRDVFGGDTRDAAMMERGFFDVVQSFVPHLIPVVNQIISAFAGRRDADGPQDDDELRERWFLPLLGVVLPALLPTVTQLVGSLTQGRGDDPVAVTDPNTAPRWFGPIISGLVSSLAAALPSIISIFTKPKP
jgi:hypothetical protein